MTIYPFNLLTTVPECEVVVRKARRDKADAENKKTNMVFQSDKSAERNVDISSDLVEARDDLAKTIANRDKETLNSIEWKKLDVQRKELDTKVSKLELNQILSVGIKTIDAAYELNVLNALIALADELITQGEARITELA